MIELMLALALAVEPAVMQEAPRRLDARIGDLYVGGAGMMAWMSSRDGLGGQVSFTVVNRGTGPDRVMSITTPAGPVGTIKAYLLRNGGSEPLPEGDMTVGLSTPEGGQTYFVAELTDVAWGAPASRPTTVTIVFERAGEVTIDAVPSSPAPPPPPRR